jgi:CheY-like chemotaxis protein
MPGSHRRETETESPAAPGQPRPPARVLLVLDRPALVELVTLTLNHGHYTLRTATSATQAVALLDAWPPHLIVFDADLDGQRVMDHVLARAGGSAHIPAIAL